MKTKRLKKFLSGTLSLCMLVGVFAMPVAVRAADYFSNVSGPVQVAVFGGSIVGSAGDLNWSNLVTSHISEMYTGGKGANINKYNVGGVGSTVGVSRMAQLVNTTGKSGSFAPNVVIIEYAVNDASVYTVNVDKTADVTASTEIRYENGKLNIYDPQTNTYTFDYVNTVDPNQALRPTGRYTVKVDSQKLLESKLRLEEMIRLAQSLDSKPAIFLVNVGLGLTLGPQHAAYPNFPGFINSIANEYDALAQQLGISYVDVEKSTWEHIEVQIAAKIADGTYADRATAKAAIELELYGDQSNIHPTAAGCVLYADFINSKIDQNPSAFLTYNAAANYTPTTSYSVNNHVKPYTAANITGTGWSASGTDDLVFPYALQTNTAGDSLSFNFSGTQLGILVSGSGYYSYKIDNVTDAETLYESSGYASGKIFIDEHSNLGGKNLVNSKNYRITLTKSDANSELMQVVGIMVNEAIPSSGYPTWEEFNAGYTIPFAEQYYNFTNKSTASDPTIQTYFADESSIIIGGGVNYERVEERDALKVTSTADNQTLLTVLLGSIPTNTVLSVEFDIKYSLTENAGKKEFNIKTGNALPILRILSDNTASPCINSGGSRFSDSIDNWWAAKCNDGQYHKVKLLIMDSGTNKNVQLYIDGNKGDKTYTAALSLDKLVLNATLSGVTVYLDDIHIYDETQNIINDIAALGSISLEKEEAINALIKRADILKEIKGSYDSITNYSMLTSAVEKLQDLKKMQAQVNPVLSPVMSYIVNTTKVFDINGGSPVTDVKLNGTLLTKDTDYFIKDGRLKLLGNLFTHAGSYTVTVVYDVDGSELEGSRTFAVSTSTPVMVNAATSFETVPLGSYGNVTAVNGLWGGPNSSWNSWSSLGTNPYYLRMDLTKTAPNYFNDGSSAADKYFKIKGLPQGNYKIEYPMYYVGATGTSSRTPEVTVELSGSQKQTMSIDPYSEARAYNTLSEGFTFAGDGTDYVKISPKTNQSSIKNRSDAILCVYGLKLTPVALYPADVVELYYQSGNTSIINLINAAANVAELKKIVADYGAVINVDGEFLSNMDAVYESLYSQLPFASQEVFKTAFDTAVTPFLDNETIALTKSLEDLRQVSGNGNFYVRSVSSYTLYDSSNNPRSAYLTYSLNDMNCLKKLFLKFTSSKAAIIKVQTALNPIPAVSGESPYAVGSEGYTGLANFADNFNASIESQITAAANEEITVDLSSVLAAAKAAGSTCLTIKFTSSNISNAGISNVQLMGAYDSTSPAAGFSYTLERVSFVNVTSGADAGNGYIGSVRISKINSDATNAAMIIAAYENHKLTQIKTILINPEDITSNTNLGIQMYTDSHPDEVKVFVWNDVQSINPCAAVLKIVSPANTDAEGDVGVKWYFPDGSSKTPSELGE